MSVTANSLMLPLPNGRMESSTVPLLPVCLIAFLHSVLPFCLAMSLKTPIKFAASAGILLGKNSVPILSGTPGICMGILLHKKLPRRLSGKESSCPCRRHRRLEVRSLGREDPLEREMATHSSILAWRIQWTE